MVYIDAIIFCSIPNVKRSACKIMAGTYPLNDLQTFITLSSHKSLHTDVSSLGLLHAGRRRWRFSALDGKSAPYYSSSALWKKTCTEIDYTSAACPFMLQIRRGFIADFLIDCKGEVKICNKSVNKLTIKVYCCGFCSGNCFARFVYFFVFFLFTYSKGK